MTPCVTVVMAWLYVSASSTVYTQIPVPFCFEKPPLRCALYDSGLRDRSIGILCLDDARRVILDSYFTPPLKA